MLVPSLLAFLFSFAAAPSRAAEPTAPAVELTASSGPVKITLRLLKTKVKVGESLQYQLRLTNVGKKPMEVPDTIFEDPWAIVGNFRARMDLFLVILDTKGKPLDTWMTAPPGPEFDGTPPYWSEDPKEQKEALAKERELRKQGLSETEVRLALHEWGHQRQAAKVPPPQEPERRILKPGETLTTRPWAYDDGFTQARGEPVPKPIDPFAELILFRFHKPGRYRLCAIYERRDHIPDAQRLEANFDRAGARGARSLARRYPELRETAASLSAAERFPWSVRAATRFIEIEVTP